jgi:hypothetical protein
MPDASDCYAIRCDRKKVPIDQQLNKTLRFGAPGTNRVNEVRFCNDLQLGTHIAYATLTTAIPLFVS